MKKEREDLLRKGVGEGMDGVAEELDCRIPNIAHNKMTFFHTLLWLETHSSSDNNKFLTPAHAFPTSIPTPLSLFLKS